MTSIDQIAAEMVLLYKELSTRTWVQYTTGFDLGIQAAQDKVNDFEKNSKTFGTICDVLEKSSDSLEKRKAKILHGMFKKFHQSKKATKLLTDAQTLENAIMDVINKFRSEIGGHVVSSSEISKILSGSPDRKRREEAYKSKIPLNQKVVDAGFLKLLNLRKELADVSGFRNFIDFQLQEDELSSDLFSDWAALCAERKAKYQQKKKTFAQKYLEFETIAPWDEAFLESKIQPFNKAKVDFAQFIEPVSNTFLKFGFDIKKLNLTYDIFPRKNKSEWGYNFIIEVGKDSRVLANVTDQFSQYWVLLHETAHGVHYMGLNSNEPALNYGISPIVAEGFANYFGNLSYSKEFLSEVFDPDTATAQLKAFQELEKFGHFRNFRGIADILFDQQLYLKDLNGENDIQFLRQEIDLQILGESFDEVPWARLIHHTSAPIYLHSYFLGDVMCENMKTSFKRHRKKPAEDAPLEFGQFWKENMLEPSGRYRLLDLHEMVCEEKLSITSYLDNQSLS